MKQKNLMDLFKKAPKSVCTVAVVVSPDPFAPYIMSLFSSEHSEDTEKEPDEPEGENQGDIQMEYSSD